MIKINRLALLMMALWFMPAAAFNQAGGGARFRGMGNASLGLKDFWSICSNQAGLAYLKETTLGISVENHFLVSELNRGVAAFAIPVNKAGVIGMTVNDFGTGLYRENMVGLAYAKSLFEDFSIGLSLNYMRISCTGENPDQNYLGFDLGLLYQPKHGLVIALHSSNPFTVKMPQEDDERLTSTISLGIAHEIGTGILLSADCEKISSRPLRFKTGLEYTIREKLFIRVGLISNPFQFSFGFGFNSGRFRADMSSTYHRFLGFSPQLSVNYSIKKSH